jgi:hypothetical protein
VSGIEIVVYDEHAKCCGLRLPVGMHGISRGERAFVLVNRLYKSVRAFEPPNSVVIR